MDHGRQTVCDSAVIKLTVTINQSRCFPSNQSVPLGYAEINILTSVNLSVSLKSVWMCVNESI